MKRSAFTTKKIVFAAMMAALTAAGSALRLTMPVSIGGNSYFHLGNIMCALSGILLGPWLGGLAAGLGSALYDMFHPAFIAECWLTFLMKGLYGVAVGSVMRIGHSKISYIKALFASATGALVYAIVYLFKSYCTAILIQGIAAEAAWIVIIEKLPATVFNAAVAIIFAPLLGITISNALKKNHLSVDS